MSDHRDPFTFDMREDFEGLRFKDENAALRARVEELTRERDEAREQHLQHCAYGAHHCKGIGEPRTLSFKERAEQAEQERNRAEDRVAVCLRVNGDMTKKLEAAQERIRELRDANIDALKDGDRIIELQVRLAQVVEALERIVSVTPDVAQEKCHVVVIRRLAVAVLAAAREQPTQDNKPDDRR